MAQVQLTTDIKNIKGYQQTAVAALVQRQATSTKPADASGRTIIGSSLNYLKFKFFNSNNTTTPTVYIYGWSYNSDYKYWEPQLLFSGTTTLNSTLFTHPQFGSVHEVSNYTLLTGDAKVYSAPAGTGNAAFILVDTLGCEFVDVHCVSTTGSTTTSFSVSGL